MSCTEKRAARIITRIYIFKQKQKKKQLLFFIYRQKARQKEMSFQKKIWKGQPRRQLKRDVKDLRAPSATDPCSQGTPFYHLKPSISWLADCANIWHLLRPEALFGSSSCRILDSGSLVGFSSLVFFFFPTASTRLDWLAFCCARVFTANTRFN